MFCLLFFSIFVAVFFQKMRGSCHVPPPNLSTKNGSAEGAGEQQTPLHCVLPLGTVRVQMLSGNVKKPGACHRNSMQFLNLIWSFCTFFD